MIPEIKSSSDLEGAIDQLEKTKDEQKEELNETLHEKVESLKPKNILKSSVAELKSNAPLQKKIAAGAVAAFSVYLLKRVWPRRWSGGLRLMIASAILSAVVHAALEKRTTDEASVGLETE